MGKVQHTLGLRASALEGAIGSLRKAAKTFMEVGDFSGAAQLVAMCDTAIKMRDPATNAYLSARAAKRDAKAGAA